MEIVPKNEKKIFTGNLFGSIFPPYKRANVI